MRRLVLTLSCLACMVAGSAAGYGEVLEGEVVLIDTGPGRATAQPGDKTLSSTQHLAAQFTLDTPETVVSMEGWIAYLSFSGTLPVEVFVYGDAGEVPDSTDVHWQQQFFVPSAGVVVPYPADWFGVYGIELDLSPGTYWVAFGLPTADFGSGVMPPTPLQELDNYAYGNPASGPTGVWTGDDTLNIGVRITVPEPSMLIQLGAGILGLLVLQGQRRGFGEGRLVYRRRSAART
jgi:hypothetical protein